MTIRARTVMRSIGERLRSANRVPCNLRNMADVATDAAFQIDVRFVCPDPYRCVESLPRRRPARALPVGLAAGARLACASQRRGRGYRRRGTQRVPRGGQPAHAGVARVCRLRALGHRGGVGR
ncbi:hypothetical protein CBM2609_B110069 [Cupriavidus taiwanensis]|nr:hypothetical protein CBM2609_B110069 [Cupriavidus taiwanensis]SOZ49619.1 hypothetical protein CBM2610_B90068 [Cupriavidus taiwanensis]